MQAVADLHLHSKYSRAVSQEMIIPKMTEWAKIKGINLLGTGDFTHPLWIRELKENLEEEEGVLRLKSEEAGVRFLLTTEISSIYSQGGKTRKIHNILIAPSFASVEKITQALLKRGCNLKSDGRPIIGLSAKDLLQLVMEADENCLVIPAHAWTPHFSLFGSESGFDSMEECFGDLAKYVYAVETGLSSDPGMNWQVPDLDGRRLVSFSDAHSPANLGRELTVFEIEKLSFEKIRKVIAGSEEKIAYTVEFYPEEGKYHFTGHRNCAVRQSPEESAKKGTTCPVCGKGLTVGVTERVRKLSKGIASATSTTSDEYGVRWIGTEGRPPYVTLVPLREIIAETKGTGKLTRGVEEEYQSLVNKLGSEFSILLKTKIEEIVKAAGEKLAEGVIRVRSGEIRINPGFDGEYGTVRIWPQAGPMDIGPSQREQMGLF